MRVKRQTFPTSMSQKGLIGQAPDRSIGSRWHPNIMRKTEAFRTVKGGKLLSRSLPGQSICFPMGMLAQLATKSHEKSQKGKAGGPVL
jgi:hypothetical protein